MTDPRTSIADEILTAPDGTLWLARCPQLLVGGPRGGETAITLDAELLPVTRVVDDRAQVLPVGGMRRGFVIALADVPPDLALAIARWMASQAEPLGAQIIATLYPAPPAPEIAL
jgi:hypothetical protein